MSKEELIAKYSNVIEILTSRSKFPEDDIRFLFDNAWEMGYLFRVQEEELNKGASY